MAKKYVKDYRPSDTVDARGRLHTEYEYIGGDYYFCEGLQPVRSRARVLCILCAVGWASWLAPLLFNNGAMHLPYISFPYIFAALTLWLLSMAAYTALTVAEPMKRKQSDRLTNWLPGTTLATAILSGIALLGTLATRIFRADALNAYDWLFGICAVLLCAAAVAVFSQRKHFRTQMR